MFGGGGCCSVEDTPSNNNEAKETSANYTVMHYQQNANDDKYTAVENDTETLTGTVGSETTAAAKSYAGFTAKEFAQVKIAADDSTTVKIYYDRKMITLTLNCDNGTAAKTITGKFGADVKVDVPTKTGYTFAAWNPELPATFPAEDAQYTANWVKEGDYIITYKNTENAINDNPAGYNVETETITLKPATKAGYIFDGWYKEDSFATKVTEIAKGSAGNITLYAKWNLETYTITYEQNGGTNAAENPTGYNVETETITLKPAVKSGYIFDGWYKEDSFATKVTEIAKGSIGNITLYAKWIITADTVAAAIGALSGEGPHDIAVVGEITGETISAISAALNKNITAKVNLDLSQTTGLTSIDWNAFKDCNALTSIIIPDSVTSIGDFAFYRCSNLKFNEFGNAYYLGNENNPYLVLIKVKDISITSCNINTATKVIVGSAFAVCSNLTSMTIPDSVTFIGEYAFYGCSNLTSVTIPDSVTSIGNYAFSNCSSLTSVAIPNSVTSIGNYAFSNCSSLTNVTIPNSVTSIDNYAFSRCSSLTTVNYKGSEEQWNAIKIGDSNDSLTGATINYNYTGE